MRKTVLPIAFGGISLIFIFLFSCTKLDTTKLGQDLIPTVDNINTFSDTLTINATQGIFDDSTKVQKTAAHVLGKITNDPLFGETDAAIYLQLKPSFYPFYFGNAGDTVQTSIGGPDVGVDSMFLCLSYVGAYGDTVTPQHLEIRQVSDVAFRSETTVIHSVKYQPAGVGPVLGAADIRISDLKNQVKFAHNKDSVTNQVRIKITDAAFINTFYGRDSVTSNGVFNNDSAYRGSYNGFAISSTGGGNGLMYIDLTSANTRLEVHYRKKNRNVIDTTFANFIFNPTPATTSLASSSANYIHRTYAGYPVNTPSPDNIYLQTSPGTYATLSIPGLTGRPNSIIHRAEILIEQTPDNVQTDSLFAPPAYMYLDLKDTSSTGDKYKPIYYDLNTTNLYDPDNKLTGYPYLPLAGVDNANFGGVRKYKLDGSGRRVAYYNINVSRYVQRMVTQQSANYTMRLYPAVSLLYPQYNNNYVYPYYNLLAEGRVRVASGSNPDGTKRIRMVIIYSKLP